MDLHSGVTWLAVLPVYGTGWLSRGWKDYGLTKTSSFIATTATSRANCHFTNPRLTSGVPERVGRINLLPYMKEDTDFTSSSHRAPEKLTWGRM